MPMLSILSSLALSSALQTAPESLCADPVFPARSTSVEGVRRVQTQVRQWQSCLVAQQGETGATPAMLAQYSRVADQAETWLRETSFYMRGVAMSQNVARRQVGDLLNYQRGIIDQYKYTDKRSGH